MSTKRIKSFVIHLSKNTTRRQYVEPQLKVFPWLDYEFFEAIYGASLCQTELAKLVSPKVSLNFGTIEETMSPADIGCAASHLAIYDKIIEQKLPYGLIMEDDIKLLPTFEKTLLSILDRKLLDSNKPLMILLSFPHRYFTKPYAKFADFGLYPIYTAKVAAAYIVNKAAAQCLIQTLRPIHQVADCWIYLKKQREITILSCIPLIVSVNYNFKSDLDEMRDKRLELKKGMRTQSDKFTKIRRKLIFNLYKLIMIGRLKKYHRPSNL